MPTGYTATLCEKGQTFPDFAMTCARAFGALVLMRDDPLDAEVPESFEADTYHVRGAKESAQMVKHLEAMTPDEQLAKGREEKAQKVAMYQELISKDLAQNERLEAMRKQVSEWTPPTDEHFGLKKFMLEQIATSMSDVSYFEEKLREAEWKSESSYYREALDSARWSLNNHEQGQRDEESRAASRTKWVSNLRKSLQL